MYFPEVNWPYDSVGLLCLFVKHNRFSIIALRKRYNSLFLENSALIHKRHFIQNQATPHTIQTQWEWYYAVASAILKMVGNNGDKILTKQEQKCQSSSIIVLLLFFIPGTRNAFYRDTLKYILFFRLSYHKWVLEEMKIAQQKLRCYFTFVWPRFLYNFTMNIVHIYHISNVKAYDSSQKCHNNLSLFLLFL